MELKFGKPGVEPKKDKEVGDEKVVGKTEEQAAKSTEKQAVESIVESTPVVKEVHYTSHPAPNFKIGKYQFTKSKLTLTPAEAEKFDALLADHPGWIRCKVRKLDESAANALIAAHLTGKMVSGVDTTANTLSPAPSLDI